jgi:hypothetical membrane protein
VISVGNLLRIGLIVPAIMVADVLVAQHLFPGFDAGAQFISELGGPKAPNPLIFNIGMILAGLAGVAAGAASPTPWSTPAAVAGSRPSRACGWR